MAVMTKNKKQELSEKLKESFLNNDVIFVAFDGLTFPQIQGLRDKLKQVKSNIKVMRNTVLYFSLKNSGLISEDKPDFLKGPTAVVWVEDPDEISTVAKILVEFSKENPSLRIKSGFISRDLVTPEVISTISKVGSKKELLSKVASALYTAVASIRYVCEAPIRDLAYVVKAVKEKKEKESA